MPHVAALFWLPRQVALCYLRDDMKHILFLLLLSSTIQAHGQEKPGAAAEIEVEEGHSDHGEVFNEGPRRAAVKIEGTGKIIFLVTTTSQEAQAFFNQGIGQLHGYWDFEAERSFRQAADIDPNCAMTYWGMAMANIKNVARARGFIAEAVKRRDQASPGELLWINSLASFLQAGGNSGEARKAFAAALKKITESEPANPEAKAFYIRQIYQNSGKGVSIENYDAVNAIAEEIFKTRPDHPAHHYVIHLWDNKKAENALKSCEACGPTAPAIAHMWHMPGHIYSKLRRYGDAAWYQEASARVDHAHTMKFQLLPDQIHNFTHNNAWLAQTLYYLGRCDDATALAMNMIELPRVPKFKKKGDSTSYNPEKSSWLRGRERLREILVLHEQWGKLIDWAGTPYLRPDEISIRKRDLDRDLAIAHFETGDFIKGQTLLRALGDELEAEKKKKGSSKIKDLELTIKEVRVYEALCSQPPAPDTARQLLPGLEKISKSRLASLWSRIGDHEKAANLATQGVSGGANQVFPLATQVHVLHAADKKTEAKSAFETLRKVAGSADSSLPSLLRLAPIAAEFGFAEGSDWRIPPVPPTRLSLDSLGPFRWTPPTAPDFQLPNADNQLLTLQERAGKNTLLIFFLGKGCVHCMEQLNDFAPLAAKYREKGIDLIAISSDTTEGLRETFANTATATGGKNPFPFPLLSDPNLECFRKYGAYDDFENKPLHGTFFVDCHQQIRWQDINYEPFMYPDWLLAECERLLGVGQ
jgi:peroxiredoxin/tetratricopeptide (TPR) repeat protein